MWGILYNDEKTKEGADMKYGFGVDLGGTTVKLAFFDQQGEMLSKWEIPTRTEDKGRQILPDIAAAIEKHLTENKIPREDVLGIGIGVPGAVDAHGVVAGCDNLGWGRTDIRKALRELTGFPVEAGNDATVAALGECWKGGGQGCRDMVMVTLGTGVGGGIILGGRPVHGVHGAGGEIGHMVLNPEETRRCNCGKYGCVEQYCSATGIVRVAKDYLAGHTDQSALRSVNNLTCKDVFDAAAAGDEAAKAILEQVYQYMGIFLANLCIVLDPQQVVIGGGVSKAGQTLLDGIRRYFDRYIYHASKEIQFRLASLGNDAGVYGAVKLIL